MSAAAEPFVPAGGEAAGTRFECGLCGLVFTHGEQVCRACPLAFGCEIVRCPRCSYAFPRESRLVAWLRRLLERRNRSRVNAAGGAERARRAGLPGEDAVSPPNPPRDSRRPPVRRAP